MKISLDTARLNTHLLDANDFGWVLDEESNLFVHERGELRLTFEDVVAQHGPVGIYFDAISVDELES